MIDLTSIKFIPLAKKKADTVSVDEDGLILCGLQEIHSKYEEANTTGRPQGIDKNYKYSQRF